MLDFLFGGLEASPETWTSFMDTGLNFLQFSYQKIDPSPELAPDPCTFLHIDLIAGYGSAMKQFGFSTLIKTEGGRKWFFKIWLVQRAEAAPYLGKMIDYGYASLVMLSNKTGKNIFSNQTVSEDR